jgi:hypothetical protein
MVVNARVVVWVVVMMWQWDLWLRIGTRLWEGSEWVRLQRVRRTRSWNLGGSEGIWWSVGRWRHR